MIDSGIVYDVKNNSLTASCQYDLMYSENESKSAYGVLEEWFNQEKSAL